MLDLQTKYQDIQEKSPSHPHAVDRKISCVSWVSVTNKSNHEWSTPPIISYLPSTILNIVGNVDIRIRILTATHTYTLDKTVWKLTRHDYKWDGYKSI